MRDHQQNIKIRNCIHGILKFLFTLEKVITVNYIFNYYIFDLILNYFECVIISIINNAENDIMFS